MFPGPISIEQALAIAIQFHQAGRLTEAEPIYRQILAQDPNHSDALHLLGVIAYQAGQHASAEDLIGQAMAVKPSESRFRLEMS